ncbi:tight adherence protein B [Virgibacillus subterraneus]|uniref:Tight adherence protein B n=1 Tax=Virgibacillus subterraneus TaxID=621109 RepID=A0A1H8ZGH7_9BACI|nr:type II secretion system F family protein [Virgibacillus subterraneus]SEP63619.1 tight adherence protein B [Virgibacillus subterraneus]
MSTTVIYIIVAFVIITIFSKIILSIIIEKGKYEKRLRKYVFFENIKKEKDVSQKEKKFFIRKAGKSLEAFINLSKNEKLLTQSGVKLSLGELLIGRIIVGVLLVMIGYMYNFHFSLLIVCGAVGFYVPIMYVKRKRKKRLNACSKQLGEALGTMANALRAGFSFMQAMKMVAEEIDDPLGPEFLKAIQDINYGVSVEDAFASLLVRLPDKELEIVLNTLLIQRSSGGNLAFLLETMQETIIDRSRVKDEVNTLTAQGKMSSVIITLLPIALALYLKLVNPEYFQMLFSHPLGWTMVIVGCINIVLGWFFIKKIVHIEV